ncbi:MAG: SufS family cysteine desulfurase [Thermaerobacter sp.]|nr:SufS family cysteine desulfurase [Thermaerobacter sp.]
MTLALMDRKADFPILTRTINGHRLTYLDSAATSQKPRSVIAAMNRFYEETNANVLRSVHTLAEESTEAFHRARVSTAEFIGAAGSEEVVFTRGTTESLNMVARGWGDKFLKPGDEVVVSPMEHHSNLIPWQRLCQRTGARLRFIELNDDGSLAMDHARAVINERTRLAALSRISNVLGTINPIREIADLVHTVGGIMVVDGAQSVPHEPTAVAELGADFLAFSGHKMCGPTGIGVLWGRAELLDASDPVDFGGEMISYVNRESATWADLPHKFEAGTPNIAGAIGLAAAIEYLNEVGMANIAQHGRQLGETAYQRLSQLPGVAVFGPPSPRAALVAFNIDKIHPHDVAQVFDSRGVAIRAGHHCCQPLMHWLHAAATARASFYLYNQPDDIDALVDAVEATKRYFTI